MVPAGRENQPVAGVEKVGFPRKLAIRKARDIKRVIEKGRSSSDNALKISFLTLTGSLPSRAQVVVPRFGQTIVSRNRLKRRLQELIRYFTGLTRGYEIVIRALPDCYDCSFLDLEKRLSSLMEKIGKKPGL